MKLEMLVEGLWVDMPMSVLKGLEAYYQKQGTPVNFDCENYQHYVMPLKKSSTSYNVYRVRRDGK